MTVDDEQISYTPSQQLLPTSSDTASTGYVSVFEHTPCTPNHPIYNYMQVRQTEKQHIPSSPLPVSIRYESLSFEEG